MLKRFWQLISEWWRNLWNTPYKVMVFASRPDAAKAVQGKKVIALIGTDGVYKWAMFRCPCGCGETLALNLMRSHSPHWRVTQHLNGTFSLAPSVDSTTCGAHFLVKNSRVIWCK